MKKILFVILCLFAAMTVASRASQITLQTYNGWWLTAEGGGGYGVYGNGGSPGGWETFTLADLNGGTLESGDPITIQVASGHYFCAEGGGGQNVVANRTAVGGWEVFYLHKLNGGGSIANGDAVAIQAGNGQFVCAENGGGAEVNANRSAVAGWETFTITIGAGGGAGGNGTPQVTVNPSTTSAQVGQTIYFSVSATNSGGLNEIGLEGCDGGGTPVSNLGNIAASGTTSNYTFSWEAPAAGTYFFDAYGWNVDRSQLTRTGVITVTVAGTNAPQVTISPSTNTATVGESVSFNVTANCAGGLNEIGLEGCDTSGTPSVNLGAVGATGTSAGYTFTWQAPSPGTYYFDAYGWNVDRSQLTRTAVTTITVSDAPASSEGDVDISSLGLVGEVEIHPGVAPAVTVTASSASITAGQGVTFTVSATGASGLSELGLEACDAAGMPLSAVGAVGVTGESASHVFTFTTPMPPNAVGSETYGFWRSAPDTYYFVAYAWNSNCTKRTRSGVIAVKVSFEANTQFEGWTSYPSDKLSETYWYAYDPRTEGGIYFIGNIPDVAAPTTNSRAEFEQVIGELDAANYERDQQLNADVGAAEAARLQEKIAEVVARGNGYKLVDQFGNVTKTVPPSGGPTWTMTTVYHFAGTPPAGGDVVTLPAFVVNGNDLSTFDWNGYAAWFQQNGFEPIHPAGVTAAAAGTPADAVNTPVGVVYQKSQLNAKWNKNDVYDILSKTPAGRAFAVQLKTARIFSFTGVDGIGRDRTTGQIIERSKLSILGVTVKGEIYIDARNSNEAAIEALFHEFQHKTGIGSTPAEEASIRAAQIQFLIDIGLRSVIPNAVIPASPNNPNERPTVDPAAIQQSIPPSYNLQWILDPAGKIYDRKEIQAPTP